MGRIRRWFRGTFRADEIESESVTTDDVYLGHVDATPTDAEIGSGNTTFYAKSDGNLYKRPYGGTESQVGGGGGGGGVWTEDGNSPSAFSGSSSHTFTLSGTYDLVEIHISDLGSSGGNDLLKAQFNGDTGANYNYRTPDGTESSGVSDVTLKNFDGGGLGGGLILGLDGRWPDRLGFSSDPRDTDSRVMVQGYNENVVSPLDQFTLFTQNGATLEASVEVFGRDVA